MRGVLGESYQSRLSFCCAQDGCRRRSTPASVRFLGRKVYLGVIVVLLTALHHGLTEARRRRLIEELDVPLQTLWRWQRWWREQFVATRSSSIERVLSRSCLTSHSPVLSTSTTFSVPLSSCSLFFCLSFSVGLNVLLSFSDPSLGT